jgi:hypothetical protein
MESQCAKPGGISFPRHRRIQVQDCIPEIVYKAGIADKSHKHITNWASKTRIDYNEEHLHQFMIAVKV